MQLHWIKRALREFRYRAILAVMAPPLERTQALELQRAHQLRERLADEYSRGYVAGWHECFESCLEAVEDEISNVDEVWKMGVALTGSATPRREN